MRNKLLLFFSAFFQVGLVSCNVVLISHGNVLGMIGVGIGISMLWSYNIKSVALGSFSQRIIYALGSGIGTYAGYLISKLLI